MIQSPFGIKRRFRDVSFYFPLAFCAASQLCHRNPLAKGWMRIQEPFTTFRSVSGGFDLPTFNAEACAAISAIFCNRLPAFPANEKHSRHARSP
jgi:hypothetical protein